MQDLLAIAPDGPKLIPFEYQLYLFDAIGSLVGTGSDQDQIAFLEVCMFMAYTVSGLVLLSYRALAMLQILLKPLVIQVKDLLESGRYKEDTPTNPFWTNHLVRLINTMGCISRGIPSLPLPRRFPISRHTTCACLACSVTVAGIPCEKEEKAVYWREAMDSVLRVLAALPNTPEIWDKVYFQSSYACVWPRQPDTRDVVLHTLARRSTSFTRW
jgi:hypothetical protein